jgi:hypothetical protein
MNHSSNKTFAIWKQLPEESLFDLILHDYCDGISLSELVTALMWYGTSKYVYCKPSILRKISSRRSFIIALKIHLLVEFYHPLLISVDVG